jgi:hypothetical protein
MTALVTAKLRGLAVSLAELKVKVRAALATELAVAVAAAIRDVLVVAILDRASAPNRVIVPRAESPPGPWHDGTPGRERSAWDDSRDPWDDPDVPEPRPRRPDAEDGGGVSSPSVVPGAAAVAVGVNVGRWWLARRGTVAVAVGFGVLAVALGLAAGPAGRAALAVLAATTDILAAQSALTPADHS